MKIKYLGHASFAITSDTGTKIITDPYKTGGGLSYGEIRESADIVTVSHDHFDHNYVAAVRGNPEVVRGTAKIKGIEFTSIPSHHDDAGGRQRGDNTIFSFEVDGIRVCHLADLGHTLSDKQIAELGKVDILFIPVGGYYTIDARAATEVCNQIKPKVIIPMHFKTEKGLQVLAGVEDFLHGKVNVSRLDTSETEFRAEQLPTTTQIIALKPEL
jgi:L-ascorbate metabolism protein UlaG (beta-lactamase superfamily)